MRRGNSSPGEPAGSGRVLGACYGVAITPTPGCGGCPAFGRGAFAGVHGAAESQGLPSTLLRDKNLPSPHLLWAPSFFPVLYIPIVNYGMNYTSLFLY